MDDGQRPVSIETSNAGKKGASGVRPLLDLMTDAIRNATDKPIGFVLDIDLKTQDRWNSVCSKLKAARLLPPAACPASGYIDRVPDYPHSVGVWMMPDCRQDHGTLEHLLQTLIPTGNPLWIHAEDSTKIARDKGAGFRDVDLMKAKLHCWLAWQSTPGQPYGMAITSKFFGTDSPEAIAFLRWVKTLFQLDSLNLP